MDGLGAQGCQVGSTVDMSVVNLGNALHNDVHDASQGFSVWTEEIFGLGSNWYFVMPNLHGKQPDGRAFCGVAIKLSYGIAISWDGCLIRHATFPSKPNGIDGKRVGDAGYLPRNHLIGTFTAVKEPVIRAGRALCAASAAQKAASEVNDCRIDDLVPGTGENAPRKSRKRRKKREKSRVMNPRGEDNKNRVSANPIVREEKSNAALLLPNGNNDGKKQNAACTTPRDDKKGMVSLENRIPRKKPCMK
jgi:hypothetical protein